MPSRSSRSRSRSRSSSSRRHKKSHKRSRRSRDKASSPSSSSTSSSMKKLETSIQEISDQNGKSDTPPIMTPSSDLATPEPKDEEKPLATAGDTPAVDSPGANAQTTRRRKRRFGDETERVFLPHMPTNISTNTMTEQQQKIYILQFRIEDLTRRLKISDYGIPAKPEDRSPSPEPIYDQQGKRQNTREVRARKKIEDERHQLITEMLTLNPEYKAPSDYKPQQIKFTDKVMIPQEDHPEVNFVGLIIGPRGSTLKSLEKDTGAKIIIRGKGSIKDGKMGLIKYGPLPGEDEPLHAYITGPSVEVVAQAAEKVNEIINRAIDEPEGMNELRKQQLRELALVKGTYRENDYLIKLKLATEAEKVVTNTIVCATCGAAGHVTGDCKFGRNPDGTVAPFNPEASTMFNGTNRAEQQKLDCEYQSLMNELTGKKDSNNSNLSLDDQRSLMSGSRSSGPTLAIAGNAPISNTPASFDNPPPMPPPSAYNPPSLMSYNNNPQSTLPQQQQGMSSNQWSTTGPRYNNNDVFDGHYLLRRHQRNTNSYSAYVEGDSYRARHIPALMEGNASGTTPNQSNWSTSQPWNQYGSSTNYQNSYQQQYYSNNNTGFIPPLPKTAPPPPPPPY